VFGSAGKSLTSDTDAINIIWNDTFSLKDIIELGASTMQDDRVQPNPSQKAQTKCEFVYIIQNRPANLDDSEFGRLGRVRRGREDTEVTLDFTFCAYRVQQPHDGVLWR